MGLVEELPHKDPFIIGLFCGKHKPTDVGEYLEHFIAEMVSLSGSGIVFAGQCYQVTISTVICDAPARSFVKCVKGRSGYFGCDKCKQSGVYCE